MANSRRDLADIPRDIAQIVVDRGTGQADPGAINIAADIAQVVNDWAVAIVFDNTAAARPGQTGQRRAPTAAEMADLDDRLTAYATGGTFTHTPSGPTGPAPEPPPHGPGEGDAGYVGQVKDQVIAAGINTRGDKGGFEITKRVAWGLRGGGAGLLSNPNGPDGYSYDKIVYKDGRGYDILVGADHLPAWNGLSIDPDKWREPIQP